MTPLVLLTAEGGSGMETAITSIMGFVSTMMTTIEGNSVLMIFFCAGILPIAIGIVRRLKRI